MDRLEAMSLLLDTLDTGSFSAAARRRGLPVATVTRKIGQLEEQLGTVLLIRSTRRLALTDAGQRYVSGVRQVLSQIDEMERDAAGEFVEPTGRLVVSAPRMFGRLHVLPVVGDFLRLHEGISVDLQLTDSNVDLTSGAADLALRIGVLPDSGLIATRLGTMRLVTVASPSLLERYPAPSDPGGLAALPEVTVDILPPGVASRLPGGSGRQSRLSVSGAEAAVDAVEAGIGFSRLLHYQVAASLRAGRLRVLLAAYEGEAIPVHFIHAPVAQLPLKTRRFLDYAIERMRASLNDIALARSTES